MKHYSRVSVMKHYSQCVLLELVVKILHIFLNKVVVHASLILNQPALCTGDFSVITFTFSMTCVMCTIIQDNSSLFYQQ